MWYKTSAATFRFSAYETLNKILRKPTIPFVMYRVKFLASINSDFFLTILVSIKIPYKKPNFVYRILLSPYF